MKDTAAGRSGCGQEAVEARGVLGEQPPARLGDDARLVLLGLAHRADVGELGRLLIG